MSEVSYQGMHSVGAFGSYTCHHRYLLIHCTFLKCCHSAGLFLAHICVCSRIYFFLDSSFSIRKPTNTTRNINILGGLFLFIPHAAASSSSCLSCSVSLVFHYYPVGQDIHIRLPHLFSKSFCCCKS